MTVLILHGWAIHLDVLTNLKRISSHVSALMVPILEEI
jgi:hypothetical protein